jgi:ribosomal protein S13
LGLPHPYRLFKLNKYNRTILCLFLDCFSILESKLKAQVAQNINTILNLKTIKGFRHFFGMPVRGQRTRTNAQTRFEQRKSKITQNEEEKKREKLIKASSKSKRRK